MIAATNPRLYGSNVHFVGSPKSEIPSIHSQIRRSLKSFRIQSGRCPIRFLSSFRNGEGRLRWHVGMPDACPNLILEVLYATGLISIAKYFWQFEEDSTQLVLRLRARV